jgi:ribosomal protein L21
MIAKQTKTTPNFKQFIDFDDSDQSFEENVDFKRNLIVEKKQRNDTRNQMFRLNSLSVEQNVVSHVSKNKVYNYYIHSS